MHLLGIPVIVLQAICAVHALKTGRAYWWLWIILLLPGIGCLVYFFAEMLPNLLLETAGQTEKAREAFGEIARRARRSPRYYRRAQKPWIDVAKQHLGR